MTAANSGFSERLGEQLDKPNALPKRIGTLVTIKPEPELACIRCKTSQNEEEESKGSTEADFYCDCGMRAVMRKLRNEILSDLNVSKKVLDSEDEKDRQLFEEALIAWFKATLVENDEESFFADADRPQFMAMMNFLLALNRHLPDKRLGCKGKRIAKQNSKDLNMVSAPKPKKHGSPFDYFNKLIFRDVEGNPLCETFQVNLTRVYRQRVIDCFAKGLQPCRAKSFDAVIKLLE